MVQTQPRDARGRFVRESFSFTPDGKLELSKEPTNWDIWENRTIPQSSKRKLPLWAILSLWTLGTCMLVYFAAHLGMYNSL